MSAAIELVILFAFVYWCSVERYLTANNLAVEFKPKEQPDQPAEGG
jgi:hypothetical protein